jgi:hypothetical protein
VIGDESGGFLLVRTPRLSCSHKHRGAHSSWDKIMSKVWPLRDNEVDGADGFSSYHSPIAQCCHRC